MQETRWEAQILQDPKKQHILTIQMGIPVHCNIEYHYWMFLYHLFLADWILNQIHHWQETEAGGRLQTGWIIYWFDAAYNGLQIKNNSQRFHHWFQDQKGSSQRTLWQGLKTIC